MKKQGIALTMAILLVLGLAACAAPAAAPAAPAAEPDAATAAAELPAEPVTLLIAGGWEDCKAIEAVARAFTAQYPNCTVEYEYLQDYYTSLEKRMTGEDAVDIFFTTNIQTGTPMVPYALDLYSAEGLDLSNTFQGLLDNFAFREEGAAPTKLYAIPLGAEMRGLYVNKTLLASVGLAIPTEQVSLLAACETLKQKGYIPFQGNPGDFGQTLLYPWICNLIANAADPAAVYAEVNAREPGVSALFSEPFSFLYTIVENGYYDYKRSQTELNLFNDTADLDYARYFFNIQQDGDAWKKADDVGQVAFLPSPMSMQGVMNKVKDDYHSAIEYVFVPAPVGPDGGFAYMSPAHGIAVNKDSQNLAWSVRFLDFLFQPEHNKQFAELFSIIPNTREAFDYIGTLYDVPADRISQLGQVTFDYGFYEVVSKSLVETSKANNPKYMQENADGTTSLYPLSYYMDNLETNFQTNE